MNVKFLDLQKVNAAYAQELHDAVCRVVNGGWYILGNEVRKFEEEYAEWLGMMCCVGCGNGLDALTLVLMSWKNMYGWDEKTEILVPANTFIATALAVSHAGLTPRFVDVDKQSALITADIIRSGVGDNTKAVIPVHLYGRICEMQQIFEVADELGLKVLEDACQAHIRMPKIADEYEAVRTMAFSFYPGKNLGALGDAGAVVTNDEQLAASVRMLGNYGSTQKYNHEIKGVNSRMDEMQAAVLRVKLRHLDQDNERRREIARMYDEGLLAQLGSTAWDLKHSSFHLYPIWVDNRDDLQRRLSEAGIATLIHYPTPCHKQLAYEENALQDCYNAEYLCAHELSLPISSVHTDEEIQYVIKTLNNLITH